MADEDVHVSGLSDLQPFLDQLAPKVEANILRGAMRAGMNIIKPVAQGMVHSVSGELAAGLKVTTRRANGQVTASLKATGPHGFVAKWIEFGTLAHLIRARLKSMLAFGGKFANYIVHPGTKAKPFMRPALDSQAQNAVIAAGEYMKDRLATEQGFNTSEVLLEGDT